jgi:hypothetical protein
LPENENRREQSDALALANGLRAYLRP